MIDESQVRGMIRQMRKKGVEPEIVYITPRLSHHLNRPQEISGVKVVVETGLGCECEVR